MLREGRCVAAMRYLAKLRWTLVASTDWYEVL